MSRESLVVLAVSALLAASSPRIGSAHVQPLTIDLGQAFGPTMLFTRAPASPPLEFREIRNVMGRCLDVTGGINADRNRVQIFDCNGTKSQQWAFRDLRLQNVMGRCLDVADGISANRTDVQILECDTRKSQQWVFIKSGPFLGIRSLLGRCLDVAGGINANRTSVQIFDCNHSKAQQWRRTG